MEAEETRLLGAIGTEERIPKGRAFFPTIKVLSQNNCFLMPKITLQKIKDVAKNLWPGYTFLYVLLFS